MTVIPSAKSRTSGCSAASPSRGTFAGPLLTKKRMADLGDDERRDAAGKREHHALGQQLPDDAPLTAAKRRPDRDFLATGRGPRQQQARDVDAANQQHEAAAASSTNSCRPTCADEHLLKRLHLDPARLHRARMALSDASRDALDDPPARREGDMPASASRAPANV